MKKKSCFLGLAVLLLMVCFGCGDETNGGENAPNASTKDCVYRMEMIDYKENEKNISYMIKGGDKLYAYGYYFEEEDGRQGIDLVHLEEDGSIKEEYQIPLEENSSLNTLIADGRGNLYAIKSRYAVDLDETGSYQDFYYLTKFSDEGEEIFSVELNTMSELSDINNGDYFYVGDIMIKDEFVYVNIADSYVKFDTDGNFVSVLEPGTGGTYEGTTLYALEDGKVAAISYEETGLYASYVDLETGEFSQKAKLPGTSYEYSVYVGKGYDLYLVNTYGVYGYNVGEEDKTQIMDYVDSDLGIYMIYNLIPVNENEFIGSYDDMENLEMAFGRFTKVDPADVKDREVLVLACAGMDWEVRSAVVKFNKANENYRITIRDYSSLYATENDYMAGINRLNIDIVSGKIPDIILINSNMPIDSYISKGLIEDLMPYIENDNELDRNNMMPNILEAFSVDGKLYRIVPSYAISTMVARTSDVGEERGWTIQDALGLMESKKEETELLSYITRGSMLINSMTMAGSQFIDWKSGKCNFDSEGFIQLLEFLKEYPEEIDDELYTEDYWINYDSMWREEKVIAQLNTLSDFRGYNYLEKGTFGEKVTMIGFPSSNEDGSVIVPNLQLAMSAKSSNQEGAWEFLRYFLTDEYQDQITYGWPLSIKRLDKMGEEAMKMPTYTDENGKEVESPEVFYMNGLEVPIDPMTKEEVERFKKELYSFTSVYVYDENLIKIVQEEAAAFFSGQKTAEEVAKIIQSRAQIYVNENR